jgi:hypothetical protein
LQKVKSYFFANIYQSPCDSYLNSKKSIKLKPPSVQLLCLLLTWYNNCNSRNFLFIHVVDSSKRNLAKFLCSYLRESAGEKKGIENS